MKEPVYSEQKRKRRAQQKVATPVEIKPNKKNVKIYHDFMTTKGSKLKFLSKESRNDAKHKVVIDFKESYQMFNETGHPTSNYSSGNQESKNPTLENTGLTTDLTSISAKTSEFNRSLKQRVKTSKLAYNIKQLRDQSWKV